jgi:hypothetical protein
MRNRPFCPIASLLLRSLLRTSYLILVLVLLASFGVGALAVAQSDAGAAPSGGCTLKNHVYHCDGAALQKALADATTVRIETHYVDGPAQGALKSLLTKKLGKKVVTEEGAPADLVFLLIPTEAEGVVNSPGNSDLGTLRVYTVKPDGGWGRLLWAETYSGQQDMEWPVVVHGLISQFQRDFQIK